MVASTEPLFATPFTPNAPPSKLKFDPRAFDTVFPDDCVFVRFVKTTGSVARRQPKATAVLRTLYSAKPDIGSVVKRIVLEFTTVPVARHPEVPVVSWQVKTLEDVKDV